MKFRLQIARMYKDTIFYSFDKPSLVFLHNHEQSLLCAPKPANRCNQYPVIIQTIRKAGCFSKDGIVLRSGSWGRVADEKGKNSEAVGFIGQHRHVLCQPRCIGGIEVLAGMDQHHQKTRDDADIVDENNSLLFHGARVLDLPIDADAKSRYSQQRQTGR